MNEYNYEPVDERWAKEILRKTGVKSMLVLRMARDQMKMIAQWNQDISS
jgi:hypothetical protein